MILVSVGIMLVLNQFSGSLTIAIDFGIMLGTAWLVLLHVGQWWSGWNTACDSSPGKPKTDGNSGINTSNPFCTKWEYRATIGFGLAVIAGLLAFSIYGEHDSGDDGEAHYELGCELYDQGLFDAAIVQHQHSVWINKDSARFYYALAKAVARRDAENSPLKPLKQAIKLDDGFRKKAKEELAFEAFRENPNFCKMVSDK